MSNEHDITTLSGFGSWMSTLTPAPEPEPTPVHEVPGGYVPNQHSTHPVFELPGEVAAVALVPAPPPAPDKPFNSAHHDEPFIPEPFVALVIGGLKKENANARFQEVIQVPLFCTLHHINEVLIMKGYKPPTGFGFVSTSQRNPNPNSLPISAPIDPSEGVLQWPVLVTDGPSCYNPKEGLRINRKEGLAQYCSRLQVQVRCIDSQLVINNDLRIGFHRTLRVPEDQNTHHLPASFGRFHLQNVASYSEKLKKSKNPSLLDMAKKSGVFFTMYQREAMWMSFQVAPVTPSSEYAIRVFVGGINVVSGRKWDRPEPPSKRKQDYILVPPQEHLDGIAISSNTVRQFIAMPIGSGYSIEKQMTGKEDVGGIQIEINPTAAKLKVSLHAGDYTTLEPTSKSPADYGIPPWSEIILVQDGNGKVVMGGRPEEKSYSFLRNLTGGLLNNNPYAITALYPTRIKVTVPSRFLKQSVVTKEFSPFAKLREVTESTKVSDKDISQYHFSLAPKTPWLPPLSLNSTLIGAGIINHEGLPTGESELPEFTATKVDVETSTAVKPTPTEPNRLKKNRISSIFKQMSPEYSRRPTQAAEAVRLYQPQPYQQQYQEMPASPVMQPYQSQYYQQPYQAMSAYPTKESTPSQYSPAGQYPTSPPSAPQQQSYSTYSTPNSAYSPNSYVATPMQYNQGSVYSPSSPSYSPSSYATPAQQAQQSQGSVYEASNPTYSPSPDAAPTQMAPQSQGVVYDAAPAQQIAPASSSSPDFYSVSPNSYAGQSQSSQGAVYNSPSPSYATSPYAPSSSPQSYSSPAPHPQQQAPKAPIPKEDAWTMGIAAGGKLHQQILPDNDIYRMTHWNKSATSMISIQVLNSVAYEAITGIVAPPTPITLQNYLSAGIPFYNSYKSGQAAQISGGNNFKTIKSVSEMDSSFGVDDGVSVAASQRVACSSCRRNLCDCVIRPCNHAFCSSCVYSRMVVGGNAVMCGICRRMASGILGFSAPMSLPGQEVVVPKEVPVVVLPGLTGLWSSIAELG